MLQKRGEITAGLIVLYECPNRTIFTDTLSEGCKVFIESLHQQLVSVPESQPCVFDLFGRDIRIPVAKTLVLLADIGLDML